MAEILICAADEDPDDQEWDLAVGDGEVDAVWMEILEFAEFVRPAPRDGQEAVAMVSGQRADQRPNGTFARLGKTDEADERDNVVEPPDRLATTEDRGDLRFIEVRDVLLRQENTGMFGRKREAVHAQHQVLRGLIVA